MFKLIIAGGRGFTDYKTLCLEVNRYILALDKSQFEKVEIVSGTAKGADAMGEKYAEDYNHVVKRFPANWEKYGRSAGHVRNQEMAAYADGCIVFWDGVSPGTKSMITYAREKDLILHIITYEGIQATSV